MTDLLSALDLAERARTLVASATDVQVSVAGTPVRVPYVDLDGAPLLVVPEGMAPLLCEDRLVGLHLVGSGAGLEGGSVVLSGSLVAVAHDLLARPVQTAVAAASRRLPSRNG